jgi:hypothetical protein
MSNARFLVVTTEPSGRKGNNTYISVNQGAAMIRRDASQTTIRLSNDRVKACSARQSSSRSPT